PHLLPATQVPEWPTPAIRLCECTVSVTAERFSPVAAFQGPFAAGRYPRFPRCGPGSRDVISGNEPDRLSGSPEASALAAHIHLDYDPSSQPDQKSRGRSASS